MTPTGTADEFQVECACVLEIEGRGRGQGPEQIRPMVEPISPVAVHLTLDAVVEIDGDTAMQRRRFLLGRRSPDRSDFTIVTSGRYLDRLVRTAAGWRSAERHAAFDIDVVAAVTASGHLTRRGRCDGLTARLLRGVAPGKGPP